MFKGSHMALRSLIYLGELTYVSGWVSGLGYLDGSSEVGSLGGIMSEEPQSSGDPMFDTRNKSLDIYGIA